MHPRFDSPRARLALTGVRARSVTAATAVVGAVLLLTGLFLPITIERLLIASSRQSVVLRAGDIAAQIAAQGTASVQGLLGAANGDATLVQVVSRDGTVVACTQDVAGEAPMLPIDAKLRAPATAQRQLSFVDNTDYIIAAQPVKGAEFIVLAAQSLAPVQRSARIISIIVYGSLPILLLLVGWATWLAVGRSLRSIDAMRQRVDSISAADLTARVPVPPAEDEVSHLARTMNRMLDRIESAAQAQRRFIADASHELRSPLASMRATLDVTTTERGSQEDGARLSVEVDRMAHLVNDLLLLAKMDEHAIARNESDVDLDDLLLAEASRLRAQTGLHVDLRFVPARVSGNPARLAQALRNLVDNAVRHAHTKISLSLDVDSRDAILTVEDDGPGIPVGDRERVFERFVRLDDHRGRLDGGSGLGLAITKEIIESHGGTAGVDSGALGGARFVLKLPHGAAAAERASNR